jgi:soluble lytic murein transglycosylase-like protein
MSRCTFVAGSRSFLCIALLGVLAACSSQSPRPNEAAEAARYAAHARGNYIPPGPPEDPWGPYVREASLRFDVPEQWIRAVMHQESGGEEYLNGQLITSNAGAMGLMQVMPDTYDELKDQYELGDDPYDPHSNILAGTAYMREMYDIYGSPGFLAAYNAGPNRLDDYLSNSRPLPDETRHYVAVIGPEIAGIYPNVRSPAEQYAMNALPIDIPPGTRYGRSTTYAWNRGTGRGSSRAPLETARLPEPPPARPEPPQRQYALALPPPRPPRGGFRLVPVANAEPLPERRGGPRTGEWAIQIGAFSKVSEAHAAISAARSHAGGAVAVAQPYVASVREPRGTLYRARLMGLSREAALNACEKLRGHGACMVISPASQS